MNKRQAKMLLACADRITRKKKRHADSFHFGSFHLRKEPVKAYANVASPLLAQNCGTSCCAAGDHALAHPRRWKFVKDFTETIRLADGTIMQEVFSIPVLRKHKHNLPKQADPHSLVAYDLAEEFGLTLDQVKELLYPGCRLPTWAPAGVVAANIRNFIKRQGFKLKDLRSDKPTRARKYSSRKK